MSTQAQSAAGRARLPPGPPGLPLLGSALELAFTKDRLGFLLRLGRDYGDVSHTFLGPWSVYMVNHPDLIEELLLGRYRDCIKDKSTRDLSVLVGQGLLTSEGEPWQRARRLAAPPLQPKRIAGYAATVVDCAERMCRGFGARAARDIYADVTTLTLEIVGKTLLGVDTRSDAERVSRVLGLFMTYYEQQLYSWQALLPLAVPTWTRVRLRRGIRELDRLIYDMIGRCRAQGPGAEHFLSRLVFARGEGGEALSDLQLRDEAVTMLLAGHETTALALTYAIFALTQHAEQRARLRAELDAFFADPAHDPAAACELPYLDGFIRESLRLYPPAYAIGREVVKSFELGGYTLPVGSQIMISQYAIQRDARFFQEPERFSPERWLDPTRKTPPRFAYFPFGGGPRICIGMHFAMMEIALVLATLVRRTELAAPAGTQLQLDPVATLRMKGGLRVQVEQRAS
jgi:cytochrome P450